MKLNLRSRVTETVQTSVNRKVTQQEFWTGTGVRDERETFNGLAWGVHLGTAPKKKVSSSGPLAY